MQEMSTREAFANPDDVEAIEAEVRMQGALNRERNLRLKAAQCAKLAERYVGIDAAVGVLIVQVADLINFKVLFDLEEPVYNDEIKGERMIKDCWLDTADVSGTVNAVNAFYLQYWAVVDRNTKQILALHNAG